MTLPSATPCNSSRRTPFDGSRNRSPRTAPSRSARALKRPLLGARGEDRSGASLGGVTVEERSGALRTRATDARSALVEAVGRLTDAAVDHVLLSEERVTSAAEARRRLAGGGETEELADKVQRVVVLATPVVRVLARGARFTRLPWAMIASSSISIGLTVRTGVRELQMLASLVAYRLEQATGAPSDPRLVKKIAIDLYLDPKRVPDPNERRLRMVRLTRKWLLLGAFGRKTSKRAGKALDAAERLDVQPLAARWATAR